MLDFDYHFERKAFRLIAKTEKLATRSQRQFIYRIGVLTIYGFQVAVPVVLGLFLGIFLDKACAVSHISWVLNCVLVGAFVGFYNANRWFYKMMGLSLAKNEKEAKGGNK